MQKFAINVTAALISVLSFAPSIGFAQTGQLEVVKNIPFSQEKVLIEDDRVTTLSTNGDKLYVCASDGITGGPIDRPYQLIIGSIDTKSLERTTLYSRPLDLTGVTRYSPHPPPLSCSVTPNGEWVYFATELAQVGRYHINYMEIYRLRLADGKIEKLLDRNTVPPSTDDAYYYGFVPRLYPVVAQGSSTPLFVNSWDGHSFGKTILQTEVTDSVLRRNAEYLIQGLTPDAKWMVLNYITGGNNYVFLSPTNGGPVADFRFDPAEGSENMGFLGEARFSADMSTLVVNYLYQKGLAIYDVPKKLKGSVKPRLYLPKTLMGNLAVSPSGKFIAGLSCPEGKAPLISVYDRQGKLVASIDSLRQRLEGVELIFIDDETLAEVHERGVRVFKLKM